MEDSKSALNEVIKKNSLKKFRKNNSKISSMIIDEKVQTIYIGSRKKSVPSHLRIYDKKEEQLS